MCWCSSAAPIDANGAEAKLPGQRDELRWDIHGGLGQDWSVETYTAAPFARGDALPARRLAAFLPGEGLGGAASHWNGFAWRWSEYEPTLRTRLETRYGKQAIPADMPIADWGVTYAEMEPYHHLFEKLLRAVRQGREHQRRAQARRQSVRGAAARRLSPAAARSRREAGLIFKAACEKLGYQPFIAPSGNSSGAYTNPDGMRLGPCQYCGHCEKFICEAQAKATPEVLLYPVLLRSAELRAAAALPRARHRLRPAGQAGRPGCAIVDLLTGEEYEQPADVVVLAAFTMTNTRLLLLGGIGTPYDPATRRGRRRQELLLPDQLGGKRIHEGSVDQSVPGERQHRRRRSTSSTTTISITAGSASSAAPASAPTSPMGGRSAAGALPPGTPRWGTKWKEASADWYAHSFSLQAQGSSYPHRDNYLDLDPVYQDAYGLPLLRMTFDWRDNDMKMSEYCTGKIAEIAKATDATIVGPAAPRKAPFDTRVYQSTHVTGGTPMGADPRSSVVSQHLQHWDAQNLFVVGASVYPHNAGYNPTALLAALALRLGDDLTGYVERPRML